MSRLAALVALANRPGTPEEGALALHRARQLAHAEDAELVEIGGQLEVVEAWRGELLRQLDWIARGKPSAGEVGSG